MIEGLSIKTNKQGKQTIYIPKNNNVNDGEVIILNIQEYAELIKEKKDINPLNTKEYLELKEEYNKLYYKYTKKNIDYDMVQELKEDKKYLRTMIRSKDNYIKKLINYTNILRNRSFFDMLLRKDVPKIPSEDIKAIPTYETK